MNKAYFSSFVAGLVFAVGLGLSGMMNPEKVQGFLDLAGKWDPSLALVMGGAVTITFILFPIIFKRKKPVFESSFAVPSNKKIDKSLITGAVLFGAGWGIGGFCPGPAIASIGSFNPNILLFVISMLTGFVIQQKISAFQNLSSSDKNNKLDECTVD